MSIILVVDDSVVDQTLVKGIMSSYPDLHIKFANDGVGAMASVADATPDVIVTDLMMPEMDGLQLVKNIRRDFPNIPVVVMTALGTEETAIEALQAGAASFVPKIQLAERLFDTVSQVLALANSSNPYSEVLQCVENSVINFQLRSELGLIPQFVDLVQRSMSGVTKCDATETIRMSLALEEAMLNALVHGNFELTSQISEFGFGPNSKFFSKRANEPPYRDRKIHVRIEVTASLVKFAVKDDGPGFDIKLLPSADDLSPFQDGIGRGLKLMRSFMDEITFNDSGNEVQLVRRIDNSKS